MPFARNLANENLGERAALQDREKPPQTLVMLSGVRRNPELVEGD